VGPAERFVYYPARLHVRFLVGCHRSLLGVQRAETFLGGGSCLRSGVRTGLRRLPQLEERPVGRGGEPRKEGRGLAAYRVGGAPPVGPAGWKHCTSLLRSLFLGRLPRGSVSVWRRAVMGWAPGSAPRGASGNGGGSGGLEGAAGASAPANPPVSPARRPTSATWGPASSPCLHGGTGAGPAGDATAWGIGRIVRPTTGIGGRATF